MYTHIFFPVIVAVAVVVVVLVMPYHSRPLTARRPKDPRILCSSALRPCVRVGLEQVREPGPAYQAWASTQLSCDAVQAPISSHSRPPARDTLETGNCHGRHASTTIRRATASSARVDGAYWCVTTRPAHATTPLTALALNRSEWPTVLLQHTHAGVHVRPTAPGVPHNSSGCRSTRGLCSQEA